MKAIKLLVVAAFALGIFISANPSGAALITSLPGGTVIAMPAVEYFGPGPQTFGPGITWSSTNAGYQGGSVFGFTGGYGFASNGYWDASIGPMAGLNDSFDYYGVTDTMTFAFSTPVQAVGGFMNYNTPNGTFTIAVYDLNNALIETATLSFSTGGGTNTGFFYGFQEASAIISYFTLTDNFIGITNLTTSAVPLPASLLLFGSGLAGLAALRRRFTR